MTMKIINIKRQSNSALKIAFVLVGLAIVNIVFAQTGGGTHPGADPTGGMSVPIDGGILMALLAGGGLFTMLLKGKKKKD